MTLSPSAPTPPPVKWRQQFALDLPVAAPGCIWLHACSVGEVASVRPLVNALLAEGRRIHLTVVTRTGQAHAERLFRPQSNPSISVGWLPWDLPGLMTRFVARLQPALLLLTETEFWPGMLTACRKRSIPVVGINTRISDRSFPRYRRSRWLWQRWLAPIDLFLAQSDEDRQRLIALGIAPARIKAVGNLKYAISAPSVDAEALRRRIDPSLSRPLLLVASTHADEERRILAMWRAWQAIRSDLLLLLVPRHPERFDEVAALISGEGLALHRWSEGDAAAADIVLVDAMGVLGQLYAVADLAIVGGSLANIGGHNPLEAAICGRGVLTGPHVQNFRDVMRRMQLAGAAVVAGNDGELQAAVERFLHRPAELAELHAQAVHFMQAQGDILANFIRELRPYLERLPR